MVIFEIIWTLAALLGLYVAILFGIRLHQMRQGQKEMQSLRDFFLNVIVPSKAYQAIAGMALLIFKLLLFALFISLFIYGLYGYTTVRFR